MRSLQRTVPTLALATILLLPSLAATGPMADDLRVTGKVVHDGTGASLPGAQVHLAGTGWGALTNADGRYAITVPRGRLPDRIQVVAQLIGYHGEQSTVGLPRDLATDSVVVDFRLRTAALELDALVISGSGRVADRRDEAGRAPAGSAEPLVRAQMPTAMTAEATRQRLPAYPPRPNRSAGGEQYAHISENAFQAVADHPLSTFSIDVDRASYSNVRRFLLGERRLPPVDAVQIEEMVNYFTYDYGVPRGDDPVAVTTEVGPAPWNRDHRLLRVGVASRPVLSEEMPPSNLVFLLDVSGSMGSPDKLPLVQESLGLLVNQLRPEDRVAIVVYAGAAGLVLESTPGSQRSRILDAIERLHAGGSTAGGAGLRLAYDVARQHHLRRGNNRVILATDGDFNVGESSDAAMVRLISERREEGTFLTVLGFGTGNLQSEKMQALAQNGNGNYAYIDSRQEARKVLVSEMGGTLLTVARDVKLQVEFNPERVRGYRLIGYENRLLAAEDFNDDRKDAGDLGAGHTVTALYEIVPADRESGALAGGVDPLRYQSPGRVSRRAGGNEIAFVKVRYKQPRGTESRLLEHPVRAGSGRTSADFDFAAAVAGFGMLLRESEHRGDLTAGQVLELAEAGCGDDRDGLRRGFVDLVRAYRSLSGELAEPWR
jgi:Ca-activated chloride channel family protein